MQKIQIYTLGELKILVDGVDITKRFRQSPKKVALLEYLIINSGRPMTLDSIMDVLWGSADESHESTLKSLVSRLRKELTECGLEDAIITRRGAYMWNPALNCEIDINKLESLCNTLSEAERLNSDNSNDFEEVMQIYNGDLLVSSGLNTWFASKEYYYHNLYIKTVNHYITLLSAAGKYDDVIRTCKTALDIDMFDPKLNIELMRALLKLGKHRAAMEQYQTVTELHRAQLGVMPSEEIREFYRQLLSEERSEDMNIGEIYAELSKPDTSTGAYMCEYTIFKDIYRLNMRNVNRTDMTTFLAVVGIHDETEEGIDSHELDRAMSELGSILEQSLRRGDTVSRYSLSQFVLMLPGGEAHETSNVDFGRLKRMFLKNKKNSKFTFDFRIMALGKSEEDENQKF